MKRIVFAAAAGALMLAAGAVEWQGLDEANWYAGPKVTAKDLAGKVVLVDEWGVNCPPCRALLPRMEQLWRSFKSKPFVLLGSHCQGRSEEKVAELVKENKLTYPIYERAGLAGAPRTSTLPHLYVVNHRGKVVYHGASHQDATEALVTAIGEVGMPPSLTGDVVLPKPYKALEKQLVLGKPIKSVVKKLEADAKGKNPTLASTATALLAAIEKARAETMEEIEASKEANPKEALKLIKLMRVTWPKEAEETYKAEVPALLKAAKEQEAAERAKAAEARKAATARK